MKGVVNIDVLTNLFKGLSDDTRLRILMLLTQGELCVCQLVGILDVSQPRISKSLAKLRDTGFVCDERREKYVYYSLADHELLLSTLALIEGQINEYPDLIADRKRLIDKEQIISICQLKTTM